MSVSSNIRLAKLVADAFHLASYPFLFAAMRRVKPHALPTNVFAARAGKYAVSFNTQVLIFLSLLLRYLPVIVDTEPMLEVVKFFSSHKERVNGLQFFVSLYKDSSSNPVYMTLLKVLPLILSATACVKSFGSEHRNGHDTISFVKVLLPCLICALFLHNYILPKRDPISVSKTASYIIEAVAVIPQLWIFSTRDGLEPSGGLDLHILCRALFRLLYVSSAVYKIVKSGKGLEGSWAENLPLLAGWLQILILTDALTYILRRRLKFFVMVMSSIVLMVYHGGSAMLIEGSVGAMLGALILSMATGGLTLLNVGLISFAIQLYRAGVLFLRIPFSSEL